MQPQSQSETEPSDSEPLEKDLNRDPITGEPGAHPVGTGVGTLGGGITGAAIGAIGGPVGAAVGGLVGAVTGAFAGKDAAEQLNPTTELAYWRAQYDKEEYYRPDTDYDDYAPAYEIGVTRYALGGESSYDEDEAAMEADWNSRKGSSRLSWEHGRHAARAAWDRAARMYPRRLPDQIK